MAGSHSHGHGHGHVCGGPDHHRGDYTPTQRADLDVVLAFNRRMSDAINDGRDVLDVEAFLDPDPLRYMWVDEGKGRIADVIAAADQVLDQAPRPDGWARAGVDVVPGSTRAARPSVATGPGDARLVTWLEWVPDRGDVVRAAYDPGTGEAPDLEPPVVSGEIADVFRPTGLLGADGAVWVFFGKRTDGDVAVWATSRGDHGWSTPELVSTSAHPSFNQEAVAHADGRVELCWQGRHEERFGIWTRTRADGAWGETSLVSVGVEANVWDPTLAAFEDGSTAYAWSEYVEGTYRVVVRRRRPDGGLEEPRDLSSGSDYALHPHLAVTRDQQLWCAFDVITVTGHGGSGPTRLRPAAEVGADPAVVPGVRPGSENVPPELLPDVEASIRVVVVGESGVHEASGELSPRLDTVPAGLPKLAATADGGLVVAYRIHRKLPLMTYYWEVATQVLGPGGWLPPTTFSGTDGTLEEAGIAATGAGVVVVAQTDARLQVALDWTEGFGGRECPYLHEHQGSVIWHGVHGVGAVVTAEVAAAGPVQSVQEAGQRTSRIPTGDRVDARRWRHRTPSRRERYTIDADGRALTLYWGDLHRHSLVSRCTAGDEPALDDFYRYAWDVCEYDFWAVTDHSENSTDYQWWSIQKIADLFLVDGRFVPLYGFEWTSADSGHQNVVYGDVRRGAPIYSAFAEGTTDPAGLWAGLAEHPDYPAVTIPHHPGSAMVYNDWNYHDPRFSRLVEIFQACRGNYEAEGAFRAYSDATQQGTFAVDGLLRGHRFGFIASSDHGNGASYVGAFAESLDRGSVFDALQQRRTFAATTRDVVVDVRLRVGTTSALMGEEVVADGPRTLSVHAEGYTDLARVDIVRNGEVVHRTQPGYAVPQGWVAVPLRIEWGGADATTRWDGRLSMDGGEIVQTPYWGPEIVAVSSDEVTWSDTTTSFGEPYGSQRGGIELTVVGPPTATVRVVLPDREYATSLRELRDRPRREVPGGPGHVRLGPGVGALTSLGVDSLDLTFTDRVEDADDDDDPGAATDFYYVRVFCVDGEMAWSSPIWVTPERPER